MNYFFNFDAFNEKKHYSHNVLLFDLIIPEWKTIINSIDPSDIWKIENSQHEAVPGGYQLHPHVTLLFGVINSDYLTIEKMGEYFSNVEPFKFEIEGIEVFKNEMKQYDVLKMSVKPTPELINFHNTVKEKFPAMKSIHSEYRPHITIAYLKAGTSHKYINPEYKNTFTSDRIIFSLKSNNVKTEKIYFELGVTV